MRVISQDGTIDIPYEMVVIQRFQEKIYFLNKNLTGVERLIDDMQLAEYSTVEKAEKAMEMLREKYLDYMRATNNETFYEFFDAPRVFQFPADNEVKV